MIAVTPKSVTAVGAPPIDAIVLAKGSLGRLELQSGPTLSTMARIGMVYLGQLRFLSVRSLHGLC